MTDQGYYLGQMKIDSLGHRCQDHVYLMTNHISLSKPEVTRVGYPAIKPLMRAAHVNEKLQAPCLPWHMEQEQPFLSERGCAWGRGGSTASRCGPREEKNKPCQTAQWVHLEIVQQVFPRWDVHLVLLLCHISPRRSARIKPSCPLGQVGPANPDI